MTETGPRSRIAGAERDAGVKVRRLGSLSLQEPNALLLLDPRIEFLAARSKKRLPRTSAAIAEMLIMALERLE